MSTPISFILNDREITAPFSQSLSVLDYVRGAQRQVGTKDGCRAGDCGACMVLIGELESNATRYMPVTSCLVPMGELHGKHLVTVEGLNMEVLSPVQQAIVDKGAAQCGFCTPGIVVSITGILLDDSKQVDEAGVKYALGGHLCRCTGYRSLKSCAQSLAEWRKLMNDSGDRISALVAAAAIPKYFESIGERLQRIDAKVSVNSQDSLCDQVAGDTDLFTHRAKTKPETVGLLLNNRPGMRTISEQDGTIHIGALTTFEALVNDGVIRKIIPDIRAFMSRIASWQVRNRATLGGNIVNASPAADLTMLLLALDAQLVLRDENSTRTVPMKKFYRAYKKLDKSPTEIVTEILFPKPGPTAKISFEKIAKRKHLDIAAVNSGLMIEEKHGVIKEARLSMGGVAPIPLFLGRTSEQLSGKPLSIPTILDAIKICDAEISPISDIRGSATYKRLLARRLIIAHFIQIYPQALKVADFYETH